MVHPLLTVCRSPKQTNMADEKLAPMKQVQQVQPVGQKLLTWAHCQRVKGLQNKPLSAPQAGHSASVISVNDGRFLCIPTDKIDDWNNHVVKEWDGMIWLNAEDRFLFVHSQQSWKTWTVLLDESGSQLFLLGLASPYFVKMLTSDPNSPNMEIMLLKSVNVIAAEA